VPLIINKRVYEEGGGGEICRSNAGLERLLDENLRRASGSGIETIERESRNEGKAKRRECRGGRGRV